MQSFCQETEFALTDDVHHNKLKSKHHSSSGSNHHHSRHSNHVAGGGGGTTTTTTTAQGSSSGGGGSASVAHNTASGTSNTTSSSSGVTATHLQQQQDQLAQLLNSNSNYYGHAFSGASPTIPAAASPPLAKVIKSDPADQRTMLNAEKRSNLSSKAAPGRAKFNSIDNESLKESGGGGGVARGVSGGASGESRKSGISPSKKLKKSSSSSGGGGGASSKHHNHHYSRTGGSSSSSSQGQKMSLDSGSTGIATTAAAAVSGYEKGVNVGYNLFAKLRELYVELRAETSPRKQSMNLLSTSFLLDKLVSRESLNTLVLNLYPGNKGYSLAFRVTTTGGSSSSSAASSSGAGAADSGSGGSSSGSSGGRRDRLQSGGGAVPNLINSGSPSGSQHLNHHHHHLNRHHHHSNINHLTGSGMHSPSSSSLSPSNASSAASAASLAELHETMRWPYEEEELLACIDNEELPLMFVDLFEKRCPQLFYSGCVIVEVRDYRQSFPISTACDKFHVLLRPTNQTLLADVQALTSEGEWSHEEKMALESQLILATAEPLCLDPSPQVGINSINGQHGRRMFNSMPIRRHAKKFSQVAINRKRKTDQFTHHFGLELFDFMARHRQRPRLSLGQSSAVAAATSTSGGPTTPTTSLNSYAAAARLKRAEVQPVRAPSLSLPESLAAPSGEVNVERFAKAFERPRETKDCMPQLVEEYVLETDRGNGRVNFIKLSILQRPSNSEYLGMLYLDRDYREDQRNGEACQFSLGTRAHANRYIQQFTEIFTEEGRKKVKITHVVPGQQPRVTCTTGLWDQQQQPPQQPPPPPAAQPQEQQQRGTPQPQPQLPTVQATTTPPVGGAAPATVSNSGGGIITVGGMAGMEQGTMAATLGPQGQLLLGKGQQFSFQVQQAVSGNLGLNKLVQQQQQGQGQKAAASTPGSQTATLTLTSPSGGVPVMQQQQQQHMQQGQILGSSQIKLLSTNLGPNQFIQFATTAVPQQQQMDGQGIIGSTAGTVQLQQQLIHQGGVQGQQQQPQQQQQPIQYAAIMNCDNSLLKNAISSGSQLGIRNGSLVLLQQNQAGKTSAVSLVQTTSGGMTVGNATPTQMHVTTLPQGGQGVVGGRQILQAGGGVPVLQAQLVGVPINQQSQPSPVQATQQQQQSSAAATLVMSPPQQQQQQQQSQVMSGTVVSGGSSGGGGGGVGGIVHQQQHHNMVQQTQAQLTTKQQNIHATNPAINALFTSLLASANQFEQQQAAAAAAAAAANNSTPPAAVIANQQSPHPVSGSSTPTGKLASAVNSANSSSNSSLGGGGNSTIINLLNSAPAAMTNKLGTAGSANPTTPGPPQLVNAFSGLVSPPPSSASSSQYGNSPATPITGTTNAVVSASSSSGVAISMTELVEHHVHHHQQQQQQQHLSKPLTKQQMTRLLNGGTESPGLSSPSPSEGSGSEQQQQHHQSNVRVTMSALASQLASPPAIMTNSIIQANKHLVVAQQQQQQQQQGVKMNLPSSVVVGTGGGIVGQAAVYGLNGMHQGASTTTTIMQQQRLNNSTPTPPPPPPPTMGNSGSSSSGGGSSRREILANIMSPGSDSNHSTASSFSLSMPTLNNLLAAGSSREVIGGPGSVGASSNGGNSMPPSPQQQLISTGAGVTNKVTTAGGNILTIHASPVGGPPPPSLSTQSTTVGGCLISNNLVQSNSGGSSGSNSMLIDRLTAMANSGSAGQHVVSNATAVAAAVPTSILQLQSQSPFLANAMSAAAATNVTCNSKVVVNSSNSSSNPSQQQHQQFTIPAASPKGQGGTTMLQNIQLQASPVVSGSVSPQTGGGGGATIMQAQGTSGTTTTLNLQGLNLASLQGAMATIPGLQNVQVQIPGLSHTISLSLSNNPGGGGGGGASNSVGVGQQMQATGGGQQTVVLTNPGGGQSLPFAQLVTSAAGLKGLAQQNQKQHLVATSVAGGVGGGVGQGTPIQLVGLQMNPGSRNLTATVSAAVSNQTQTATILSAAGQKLPVHRLGAPQLVRATGTTLKLTQASGLQVQGGNATTQGIFVNQSSGLNSILMTPHQLQALQKQKHQQQQAQQQQQQMQSSSVNVAGGAQVPTTTIVAKAAKHGK